MTVRCAICHEPVAKSVRGHKGWIPHPDHTAAELAETKAAVDAAGLILATDAMLWLTAQMARSV